MEADKTEIVAGVDEAGRGPLAGPVVAAAVVLGVRPPEGLTDSKRLSPASRDRLFQEIVDSARAVSYYVVSPRQIDRTDILRATLKAMREAVTSLSVQPTLVRVDGLHPVPGITVHQETMVRGDLHCPAVSAASIVAKVIRDRIMTVWDRVYPAYGFANHKGYGTRVHLESLSIFGACTIHRFSFAPVQQAARRVS